MGVVGYFSVRRIQDAIKHLRGFESKWVVIPWVLAMNGVGRQAVNTRGAGQPGTTTLVRRFFDGSLIGLPPFETGSNLMRPVFRELTPAGENDYIVHQDTELWGNVFSRAGYREMRDQGLLGGKISTFSLTGRFRRALQTNLAGFQYEQFLVWLFAFQESGFAASSWGELDQELRGTFANGRVFPREYLPFLSISRSRGRLPWPRNNIQNERPTNEEFRRELIPSFHQRPTQSSATPATSSSDSALRNLMVCGAPGTGKSFYIEQKFPDVEARVRTVFYPDYTYSDFVGSYQPVEVPGDNDEFRITYRFVPGPFTRALVGALNNPSQNWVLIVEEISRAPAAAVFGDLFQLLDRLPDGRSEYPITPSAHLSEFLRLHAPGWNESEGLRLPANLHLCATMNPADQGVQRLDSAFKRRWTWHYILLDMTACPYRGTVIPLGGEEMTWAELCTTINSILKTLNVPEDRLIGPFFLRADELADLEQIAGKLLHYLWDDVLRHQDKQMLFVADLSSSFSDLARSVSQEERIFSPAFYEKLAELRQPAAGPQSAEGT
jgi:hypothetical protein